jgi:hypothetical protein
VQQVGEALALFADQILGRDEQVLDEEHVTFDRLAAHLRDRLGLDLLAVGIEQREAWVGLAH